VILINLLPHREAARKRRREAFYGTLGAAAILGVLIAGLGYLWFEAQISAQRSTNGFLQAEIKKLEVEIKEISTLQEEMPRCARASRRSKTCRATATCPCTCSMNWSGNCPMACT